MSASQFILLTGVIYSGYSCLGDLFVECRLTSRQIQTGRAIPQGAAAAESKLVQGSRGSR